MDSQAGIEQKLNLITNLKERIKFIIAIVKWEYLAKINIGVKYAISYRANNVKWGAETRRNDSKLKETSHGKQKRELKNQQACFELKCS